MTRMYGYAGKILRINLTNRTTCTFPTSNYDLDKYIGGRGLAAKIHWDEVGPNVQAFDPENVIAIMTGPTTATAGDGGIAAISYVSPWFIEKQTYYLSTVGGHFGVEIKFAGYDGFIIEGKASVPVYITIQDDEVVIQDADDLWGLDTYSAQQNLWSRYGKARILSIGPAGENMVHDAICTTDTSSVCGMGGLGAVFGSKNLKAILVKGTGGFALAEPQKVLELAYAEQRLLSRKQGEEEPPPPWRGDELFYPTALTEVFPLCKEVEEGTIRRGFSGCYSCPVCCGASVKILDGSDVGSAHIKCMDTMGDRLTYARQTLLDRLGLTSSLFFARMDQLLPTGLFNQWIPEGVTFGDQSGTVLFGGDNATAFEQEEQRQKFILDLVRKISHKEGVGELLSDGLVKFCLETLKTEEARYFAESQMKVSGMHRLDYGWWTPPYRIPGMLCIATSTKAGMDDRSIYNVIIPTTIGNTQSYYTPEDATDEIKVSIKAISEKMFGTEQAAMDMLEWKWGPYNAQITHFYQNMNIAMDSFTRCKRYNTEWYDIYANDGKYIGDLTFPRKMYSAVTGKEMDEESEVEYCNRIYQLEHAILTRQGHTREDDNFFDSVYEDKVVVWGIGYHMDKQKFNDLLTQYYEIRGMDPATGLLRRSTLEALDLEDVADDLEGKYGISLPA